MSRVIVPMPESETVWLPCRHCGEKTTERGCETILCEGNPMDRADGRYFQNVGGHLWTLRLLDPGTQFERTIITLEIEKGKEPRVTEQARFLTTTETKALVRLIHRQTGT